MFSVILWRLSSGQGLVKSGTDYALDAVKKGTKREKIHQVVSPLSADVPGGRMRLCAGALKKARITAEPCLTLAAFSVYGT